LDKKNILIIDDDKDFCLLVKMNLETLGDFKVLVCHNSQEGIEKAQELQPDLILLDLIMPEIDGFQMLKLLKKDPETKHIPVVILTVKDDEVSRLRASQLYSEDYITKPIGADKLNQAIGTILEKREEP